MEKKWFYQTEQGEKGPFTLQELRDLKEKGAIDADCLVRLGESGDWKPLSEVEQMSLHGSDVSVLPPEEPDTAVEFDQDEKRAKERSARPWVRFWARMLDYTLFAIVAGWIMGWLQVDPFSSFRIWQTGMIFLFFWLFIEAVLLSTWGTTPGKALFKSKVRTHEGEKLHFGEALNRSFSVWFLGMGAGVPVISQVTMIVACVKVSNLGIATWDRRSGLQVVHGKIGFFRTFIAVVYFAIIAFLLLSEVRHAL